MTRYDGASGSAETMRAGAVDAVWRVRGRATTPVSSWSNAASGAASTAAGSEKAAFDQAGSSKAGSSKAGSSEAVSAEFASAEAASLEIAATEVSWALRGARRRVWGASAIGAAANAFFLGAPLFALWALDVTTASADVATPWILAGCALAALAAAALLDGLRAAGMRRASTWLGAQLGPALLEIGVRAVADRAPLASARRASRDLETLRSYLTSRDAGARVDGICALFAIAACALISPALGAAAALAAALIWTIGAWSNNAARDAERRADASEASASAFVDGAVAGAETATAMRLQADLSIRWRSIFDMARDARGRAAVRREIACALSRFLQGAGLLAVLALGAVLIGEGTLTAAAVAATALLTARALAAVGGFVEAAPARRAARDAEARLQLFAARHPLDFGGDRTPPRRGRLSVRDLSAPAPNGGPAVLREVSFDVAPGEVLAVIGAPGAGKTALARALVGLGDADAVGAVRLDDVALENWNGEALGDAIGYAPQAAHLFPGTIAENIARMGVVDGIALRRAARLAGAHEAILDTKDGYETRLEPNDPATPPSLRGRIALARALYGDPSVVVLDEPDAGLDAAGREALLRMLGELRRTGATVVFVCADASLASVGDATLNLADGRAIFARPPTPNVVEPRIDAAKTRPATDPERRVGPPALRQWPAPAALSSREAGLAARRRAAERIGPALNAARAAATWMADAAGRGASEVAAWIERARAEDAAARDPADERGRTPEQPIVAPRLTDARERSDARS